MKEKKHRFVLLRNFVVTLAIATLFASCENLQGPVNIGTGKSTNDSTKLAGRFLDEFHRVVNLLVEFPGLGTPADEVRRVHILQDFPYSVIYREDGEGIRILIVRSQYRDPEYGESRS